MSLLNRSAASLFASERQEYRLMFALSYPVFFVVALVSRFVPERLRPLPMESGSFFSVFRDARAAAHSVLPFAFMR